MDSTVDTGMIVEYGLTTLVIFLLIFLLAVLTPWLAKHVDSWIAKYRASHNPKEKEIYTVRSIYELPPAKTEAERQSESAPMPESEQQKKKIKISAHKKQLKK